MKIRTKLLVYFMPVVCIPLIFVSILAFWFGAYVSRDTKSLDSSMASLRETISSGAQTFSHNYESMMLQDYEVIADQVKLSIERHVKFMTLYLESVSSSSAIEHFSDKNHSKLPHDHKELTTLFNSMIKSLKLTEVALVDHGGGEIVRVTSPMVNPNGELQNINNVNENESQQPWFRKRSLSDKLTDIYIGVNEDMSSKHPVFAVILSSRLNPSPASDSANSLFLKIVLPFDVLIEESVSGRHKSTLVKFTDNFNNVIYEVSGWGQTTADDAFVLRSLFDDMVLQELVIPAERLKDKSQWINDITWKTGDQLKRTSQFSDKVLERIDLIGGSLFGLIIITIVVALVSLKMIDAKISDPIKRISQHAVKIGQGDLENVCLVTTEANCEISALSQHLELMRQHLKDLIENLDDKIRQKTVELIMSNEKLVDEVKVRKSAENEAVRYKEHLEDLVGIRTAQLEKKHGELERLNKELQESTVQAQKMAERANLANNAKSEFLATMSHEIRTPLNAVIGLSEILMESNLESGQLGYVQSILRSAEALLATINDVLDLSRIEKGKLSVEIVAFNVEELIESVSELVRLSAQDKALAFKCSVDPQIKHHVLGDPARLRQVLVNLCSNAIKFTHKGFVHLTVESLSLDSKKQVLKFIIEDTGIGIDREKLNQIFDRFLQLDSSTTRSYGGIGLGLAISKELVELMNGIIRVESSPSKGSTFWIEVPFYLDIKHIDAAGVADSVEDVVINEQPLDKGELQILVAEDDPVNQIVCNDMLKRLGYKATMVKDGVEARDTAAINHFDIIFMDWHMPQMDGLEATNAIRNSDDSLSKDTIIIALTANAMKGDREKCLEAGMDDYLTKPLKKSNLESAINRWVGKLHEES